MIEENAIATKEGQKFVIECKRYSRDKKVGRPALQKFFAAMHEEKAIKGFFVSTCSYAHTAIKYAKQNNIELIDLEKLALLMNKAYGNLADANQFRVMCLECGNIIDFFHTNDYKLCLCGYLVEQNVITKYT